MVSILSQRFRRLSYSAAPSIVISFLLELLVLGTTLACSHRIADFTGISTKNIYAKGVDVSALPKLEGVEGKDIRFLGIGANIKDALDEALEKGHGNLMIDCAVYIWSAPFVAGYKVRGSVIDIPYRKQPTTTQASGP